MSAVLAGEEMVLLEASSTNTISFEDILLVDEDGVSADETDADPQEGEKKALTGVVTGAAVLGGIAGMVCAGPWPRFPLQNFLLTLALRAPRGLWEFIDQPSLALPL